MIGGWGLGKKWCDSWSDRHGKDTFKIEDKNKPFVNDLCSSKINYISKVTLHFLTYKLLRVFNKVKTVFFYFLVQNNSKI